MHLPNRHQFFAVTFAFIMVVSMMAPGVVASGGPEGSEGPIEQTGDQTDDQLSNTTTNETGDQTDTESSNTTTNETGDQTDTESSNTTTNETTDQTDTQLSSTTSDQTTIEAPSVATNGATNVDIYLATLNGNLTDLGSHEEVEVYFEYGEANSDLTRQTDPVVVNETGSFETRLEFLDPDTDFEFRAVAEGNETVRGETRSFSTEPGSPATIPFIEAGGVDNLTVWAGAIAHPRVDPLESPSDAGMTTAIPPTFLSAGSTSGGLDKNRVSVYDRDQNISIQYNQRQGAVIGASNFQDSSVDLVAVRTETGQDGLPDVTDIDSLLQSEENTAQFVERDTTLNNGSASFVFNPPTRGNYVFLVMNSDSVEIADGNITERDNARVLGVDIAVVQDRSSVVTPTRSDGYPDPEYRPGENVTVDVETEIDNSTGTITHAVVLYDETKLGGESITVNAESISDISLENISSTTSIKRFSGIRETDEDAELMGQDLGDQSEVGPLFSVSDLVDFIGSGIDEDLAPSEGESVINASMVAESGTGSNTTLEVGTLENFSTGDDGDGQKEYTIVHIAENNETGELETNRETVTLRNKLDPFATVDIDEEDSELNVLDGEEIVVNATVTNIGNGTAEDTATLELNGKEPITTEADSITSRDFNLTGGESQQISLIFNTSNEATRFAYDDNEQIINEIPIELNAEIVTEDYGNDSTTVSVGDQGANFSVDVDGGASDDEVVQGENLTIVTNVTNDGDIPGTQTIEATLENQTTGEIFRTETTEVSLNSDTTNTAELTFEQVDVTPGNYTVNVSSENDFEEVDVEVLPGPDFEVDLTSVDDPVVAGEVVDVTANISNVGAATGTTEEVEFLFNGTTITTNEGVKLNESESATFDFSAETNESDVGERDVTVRAGDASNSTTVTVQSPAEFDIVQAPSVEGVIPGENATIEAQIENVGDVPGTQNVTLVDPPEDDEPGGSNQTVDEKQVSIEPGVTETVDLVVETDEADAGETLSYAVATEDDSEPVSVSLLSDANFTVDIDESASETSVVEDENLTVVANITNDGGVEDTQEIAVAVNETGPDGFGGYGFPLQNVTLAPDESQSIEINLSADDLNPGSYTATVSSDDTEDSLGFDVIEAADIGVEITETNEPIVAGEQLNVTANVSNAGEANATEDVEFLFNGTSVDTEEDVTIEGDETRSFDITVETETNDFGEPNVTVRAGAAEDTQPVTVRRPATIEYANFGPRDTAIKSGQNVTVTADVENVGDVQTTVNATLAVELDGQQRATLNDSVTLNGSEAKSVQFEYSFEDTGTYNLTIADSGLERLSVEVSNQVVQLNLSATETEPLNGSDVRFVTNATPDGEPISNATVTVNGAEATTNGSGVAVVQVTGDDEVTATASKETNETTNTAYNSDSVELYVLQPSDLVYDDLSVSPDDPETRESVTINATVTNTDEVQRAYNATVFVDGEPIDATESGTLNASETKSLSFTTTFDTFGIRDITVGDADIDGENQTTSVSIGVDTTERQLRLTTNITNEEGEINQNDTVKFFVETDSEPAVNNATINVDGEELTTGDDGTAAYTFNDSGEFTATATKPSNDSVIYLDDSVDIQVNAPTDVQVTDVSALREQIFTGETLTVEVTVENVGDLRGSEEVNFAFQTTAELNGSESQTLVFEPTANETADQFPINVEGETFQTITVDPALATTEFTAPSTVTIGEDLVVTATVENRGSSEGSKTVRLSVNGTEAANETVTVPANGEETVDLAFDTTGTELGETNVSVDDRPVKEVRIVRQSVGLTITSNATASTTTGDPVQFTVRADGEPIEGATIRVNDEEFTTGPDGTNVTTFDDADRYTARATNDPTANRSFERASTSVRVREPAALSVADAFLPTDQTVVGDDVELFAVVENDGGVEGTIELNVTNASDETVETRNVTLGAGESTTVTLTPQLNTTAETETLTVNGVEAGDVGVLRQSVITDVSVNSTAITTDDAVLVNATVTNRGTTADEDGVTVNITAGDETSNQTTETIPNGESETVSATFAPDEDVTISVEGPANSFTRSVTVAREVEDLQVEANPATVTEGEELNVTVRADGNLVDATLEIDGDPFGVTDGTANISTPDDLAPGDYTVVATKESDTQTSYNSDSVDVTVQEQADIEVDDAYRLVTQAFTGDNVTVEADVVNNGDLSGNETINLTDGSGEVLANQTVDIDGGNETTITLNATFDTTETRTLSVGDEVAGSVEIDPQTVVTDFTVSNATVTVAEQETTLNATVRNRGSTTDESFAVNLSVGGEEDVDNITVTSLGAGEVDNVEFTRTFDTVGRTNLTVNDAPVASVLVTQQIEDLDIDVETQNPTTDDTVRFNVTNSTGGAVEDATIVAGGQVLETNASGLANATFASGTVTASATKDTERTSFNPDSETFTVNRPANVRLLGADVDRETVNAGETVSVEVDLLNIGGIAADRNVTLEADDETVNSSVETIPAGDAPTVTLSAQLNQTGDRVLSVSLNGTDPTRQSTVTVDPAASVTNYTVNDTAISVRRTW